MRRVVGAGSVVLAALALAGVAEAAPTKCAKPAEITAIQAAAIQQELMVAALTCNQVTSFNAFQTGYSSELRSSDKTLEKMFKRLFGGGAGEAQYHAFKTRLANDSSIRSIHDNSGYCKEAQTVFAAALTPEKPTLAVFVSGIPVTEESPVDSCEIRVAMNLKDAIPAIVPKPNPLRMAALAPAAPVAPPPAPPAAAPAAPQTATASAAPAAVEPGVLPDDMAPPPAPQADSDQQKPSDEKPSGWLSGIF